MFESRSHAGTTSGLKSGASGQSNEGNSSQVKAVLPPAALGWRRLESEVDVAVWPSSIGLTRGVEGWVMVNLRRKDDSMSRSVSA